MSSNLSKTIQITNNLTFKVPRTFILVMWCKVPRTWILCSGSSNLLLFLELSIISLRHGEYSNSIICREFLKLSNQQQQTNILIHLPAKLLLRHSRSLIFSRCPSRLLVSVQLQCIYMLCVVTWLIINRRGTVAHFADLPLREALLDVRRGTVMQRATIGCSERLTESGKGRLLGCSM